MFNMKFCPNRNIGECRWRRRTWRKAKRLRQQSARGSRRRAFPTLPFSKSERTVVTGLATLASTYTTAMALRRLAQENNAFNSPRSSTTGNDESPGPKLPKTPRNRVSIGVYRSPVMGPSRSASIPFDWEAARSLATPPYGTPMQRKARRSMGVGSGMDTPNKTPRKALVRKRSLWKRYVPFPVSLFVKAHCL
jgi:hypothetical protein